MVARRDNCSDDERNCRNARAGNIHTMNRRPPLQSAFAGVGLSLLALDGPAVAADMPVKAPHIQAVFDWTGLYIGAHAGYSRGSSSAVLSDPALATNSSIFSGTAGGGLEYAFAPHWSARLEYLYSRFERADIRFPSGTQYASTLDFQSLRLGLNRKIDWPGSGNFSPASLADPESDRWEIHGQRTFLPQGYPAFHAPYSGPNSLTPAPQLQQTWSNSLFLNARLWEGGEIYYNPELLQGFGLNDTVGVAGFPSGEAQKSNFPYPHYNTSRLFVRQTFGFCGEQEELASGPIQLASNVDVWRRTLQAGKFAVVDIFDGNAYAKDPRKDVMNWSLWSSGAFDYSADKLGLTYGVTAELNQKQWALRSGYFLMDAVSNSNSFDTKVFQRGGYVLELETRYSLFSHPGNLRTIAWLNSAFSGSYRETLDNPAFDLDIAQTRTGRIKYGYVINLEQALTDEVGLFGRWSWNDGNT